MPEASTIEASSWRTLDLPGSSCRILVKSHFGSDGYRILLTDLSRVWHETLGRAAIIERADEIDCSIEPSEDDQYRILIGKISGSLKGEYGTSCSLRSQQDGHRLEANVTAPLPSPLPRFNWRLYLDRMPDTHVQSELVYPLLVQTEELQHQIQSLLDEIRTKDRIISKITDRLETSGNDLTTVFPGVANVKISRKRAQRTQLAKYIKGLGDFEEDEWRTQTVREEVGPLLSDEVINRIFKSISLPEISASQIQGNDRWWTDLKEAPTVIQQASGSRSRDAHSDAVENDSTRELELESLDSDFQRQATPSRLARDEASREQVIATSEAATDDTASPKSEASTTNDDVTEEEDDLDTLSRRNPLPQTRKPINAEENSQPNIPVQRGTRQLGKLGGPKGAATQRTVDQEPRNDESQSPVKSKAKARLGMLGGNAKEHLAANASSLDGDPLLDIKPKGKLGVLGGKAKGIITASQYATRESKMPNKPDSPVPPSDTHPVTSPVRTEVADNHHTPAVDTAVGGSKDVDSQERADQKRDKLKRELAEKAKVPAKKKRKF